MFCFPDELYSNLIFTQVSSFGWNVKVVLGKDLAQFFVFYYIVKKRSLTLICVSFDVQDQISYQKWMKHYMRLRIPLEKRSELFYRII